MTIEMGAVIEVSGTGEKAQIENTIYQYVEVNDKYEDIYIWDNLFEFEIFIVGFSAIVRIVKIVLTIYIMYLSIKALRKYIDA